MVSQRDSFRRLQVETFRVAFDSNVSSTAVGAFLSIAGVANKIVRLREVEISKPDAAFTLGIARVAVTPTTGTYTEMTSTNGLSNMGQSTGSTYGGTARRYTVIPTLGGTTNLFVSRDMSTLILGGETANYPFGGVNDFRTAVITSTAQAFILNSSLAAAVTSNGFVEFTVEP